MKLDYRESIEMSIKTIFMFAPLTSPLDCTNLAKVTSLMLERGFQVRFFGWKRMRSELLKSVDGLKVQTILCGGGYVSRRARMMYLVWMLVVFWQVLRLGRDHSIICRGWETAFPARIAAFFTGARIIFHDTDRFSMIIRLPRFLKSLLQSLERWTSHACALHIVPGFSRYEWRHDNMLLLLNTPMRRDLEAARNTAPPRPEAQLVLYANGWVGETRGAPVFLELMERISDADLDIHLVIVGRIDGPKADRLINHEMVTYLAPVAQSVALSWYSSVDLLLTFYDPAIEINLKAESNKWGDAVYFKTPFIVNSEVETARIFTNSGAAFSVPYHDVDALLTLVKSLVNNEESLAVAKTRLSAYADSFPVFDDSVSHILNRIIAAGT